MKKTILTGVKSQESDGSITLWLNEIDLVENAETEELAKNKLAESLLQYAKDYCDDFEYWNSAINRRKHLPYIMIALVLDDIEEIKKIIEIK